VIKINGIRKVCGSVPFSVTLSHSFAPQSLMFERARRSFHLLALLFIDGEPILYEITDVSLSKKIRGTL